MAKYTITPFKYDNKYRGCELRIDGVISYNASIGDYVKDLASCMWFLLSLRDESITPETLSIDWNFNGNDVSD